MDGLPARCGLRARPPTYTPPLAAVVPPALVARRPSRLPLHLRVTRAVEPLNRGATTPPGSACKEKAMSKKIIVAAVAAIAILGSIRIAAADSLTLLNVSYDPTRELWRDLNSKFVPAYEKTKGTTLAIK